MKNDIAISRRLVGKGVDKKLADAFAEALVTNCDGDFHSRFLEAGVSVEVADAFVEAIREHYNSLDRK